MRSLIIFFFFLCSTFLLCLKEENNNTTTFIWQLIDSLIFVFPRRIHTHFFFFENEGNYCLGREKNNIKELLMCTHKTWHLDSHIIHFNAQRENIKFKIRRLNWEYCFFFYLVVGEEKRKVFFLLFCFFSLL